MCICRAIRRKQRCHATPSGTVSRKILKRSMGVSCTKHVCTCDDHSPVPSPTAPLDPHDNSVVLLLIFLSLHDACVSLWFGLASLHASHVANGRTKLDLPIVRGVTKLQNCSFRNAVDLRFLRADLTYPLFYKQTRSPALSFPLNGWMMLICSPRSPASAPSVPVCSILSVPAS